MDLIHKEYVNKPAECTLQEVEEAVILIQQI